MPKSSVLARPGEVKETVIQERVVPAEETEHAAGYGVDPYDFMALLTEDEWRDYLLYVYRKSPPPTNGAKRTYIAKLAHAIDDTWLKENCGGGVYHMFLKKGSARIKEWDSDDIPGPPKDPDQATAAASARVGNSELVQTIELILNKMGVNNGGGNYGTQLTFAAVKDAMEIQKSAIVANQLTPMQIIEMTERLRGSKSGGEWPDWAKQALAALIPVGVGLIQKMLEPKDAIATIEGLSRAMTAMKGIGGETPQTDIGVEVLRNGPQLLRGISEVLAEARKASELRALAPAPAGVSAQPPRPPSPGAAIPLSERPVGAAPEPPAGSGNGAPSSEFVWAQVVKMCKNGDDGKFAFSFLDQIDPASMKWLRDNNFTLDQLKQLIETGAIHPSLMELSALPNYAKFIADFHAAVMSPESGVQM